MGFWASLSLTGLFAERPGHVELLHAAHDRGREHPHADDWVNVENFPIDGAPMGNGRYAEADLPTDGLPIRWDSRSKSEGQ